MKPESYQDNSFVCVCACVCVSVPYVICVYLYALFRILLLRNLHPEATQYNVMAVEVNGVAKL